MGSPLRPRQRRLIELQQEQNDEAAAAVLIAAAGNHPATTIHHLNDDLLRLSHAFLCLGHFRYLDITCKMFLKASEVNAGYRKIATGESVTSPISCGQK